MAHQFKEISWRKSSYSSGDAGNSDCVEMAVEPSVVGLRDSKNAAGPVLVFTFTGWRIFLDTVR